jgi:hypothetical protein
MTDKQKVNTPDSLAMRELLAGYEKQKLVLRLGQYFIVMYCPLVTWPELFYEEDIEKAKKLISTWLDDHQYTDHLPQKS